MKSTKRIGIVCCYFGRLPWYFSYFAHTCRYNSTIDFIFFTDNDKIDCPLPDNFKVVRMELSKLNKLASDKLKIDTQIFTPYKLCDFKPAYGIIFSEYLVSYDFWGHTDIDIIFGQIRNFITDDLMQNYDLISVRHDWLTGCFLLYRNTLKMNTLFKKSKDHKKVFSSERHFCFDETNFAHDEFSEGTLYADIPTEIESMTHVVKRLESEGYMNPFFEFFIIEGLPGNLTWSNGILTYRNRFEVLCYHMIHFKKICKPKINKSLIPVRFKFSPSRIY